MSLEENKEIVRRCHTAWWTGNDAVASSLANSEIHQQVKDGIQDMRKATPDLTFTIEEMIAEGDKVVFRWTIRGTPAAEMPGPYGPIKPSGKSFTCAGITINRLMDGKIVEDRAVVDVFSMMQQLGVVSTPG